MSTEEETSSTVEGQVVPEDVTENNEELPVNSFVTSDSSEANDGLNEVSLDTTVVSHSESIIPAPVSISSVNKAQTDSESESPKETGGWYPGKFIGLKNRRLSASKQNMRDNTPLEEIDMLDSAEMEFRQTSWSTFNDNSSESGERHSSMSSSTWLYRFSKKEKNETSNNEPQTRGPNPNNLGKLTEHRRRSNSDQTGQTEQSHDYDDRHHHDNDDEDDDSHYTTSPTQQSTEKQSYTSWFRRRNHAANDSNTTTNHHDVQENSEKVNEAEEKKKESIIAKTIRTIRNKFVDRQLQGRILIYRISCIVATAVTCDILSTDKHSYPGNDPNAVEDLSDLSFNDRRALSMTDTILNSLERRSLAWDGVDFASEVLLTRGCTIGVSDPFIGIIGFSITIDISATVESLLASRKRYELKVRLDKEDRLARGERESFVSRSISFSMAPSTASHAAMKPRNEFKLPDETRRSNSMSAKKTTVLGGVGRLSITGSSGAGGGGRGSLSSDDLPFDAKPIVPVVVDAEEEEKLKNLGFGSDDDESDGDHEDGDEGENNDHDGHGDVHGHGTDDGESGMFVGIRRSVTEV